MSEREIMEYDVLVVGAGPAGLACAIRLKQKKPDLMVAVIEKGAEVGAHILSGAVIEPGPLDELLPGWRDEPPPVCIPVTRDEIWLLRPGGKKTRLPTPPQQKNHGNYIVSMGNVCRWMAEQAEAMGVEVYPGMAASELVLREDGSVKGVVAEVVLSVTSISVKSRRKMQGRLNRGRANIPVPLGKSSSLVLRIHTEIITVDLLPTRQIHPLREHQRNDDVVIK